MRRASTYLRIFLPFLLIFASRGAIAQYSFSVKVVGAGRPIVLIPGLACGPGVWDTTVDHLKQQYECHILGLPGFAGQPAEKGATLDGIEAEIAKYVQDKHLSHPILIGHSLGGMLALWLASDHPDLFSAVISVDGVPYLAALSNPNISPSQAFAAADQIKGVYAKMSQSDFAAGEQRMCALLITDSVNVQIISADCGKSDPVSVGNAAAEMLTHDLRPQMHSIRCPVLMMISGAEYPSDLVRASAMTRYEDQIKTVPHHQIVPFPKARHFIMIDDPTGFLNQVDGFLSKLP